MDRKNKIPVLVIFAPTACGKTALAKNLFGKSSFSILKDKAEVISADSQAVYKGLNIGTAKPDEEEKNQITHHLIDIVDPNTQFGVGDFVNLADGLCNEIYARKKLPVLLGGTGFYLRNFIYGLTLAPESDPLVRENLKKRIEQEGNEVLYAELKKIDPNYAEKINVNDAYRICRALEVYYTSGRNLSSYQIPNKLRENYNFCILILTREKKDLYNRICLRVDKMFQDGLEQEVENLKKLSYTKDSPGMKAIGYKEFFQDFESKEDLIIQIKHNSKRYAKRQYTYMKEIPEAQYLSADDESEIERIIIDFYNSTLGLL